MDYKLTTIKGALGVIMTLVSYALGEWDTALQILLMLIVVDYISGLFAAYRSGNLDSRVGFLGIIKKVMYIAIVVVANTLDELIGLGGWVREMTIYFLVANEALSILENAAECGAPVPQFLIDKLEQLKGNSDKGETFDNRGD